MKGSTTGRAISALTIVFVVAAMPAISAAAPADRAQVQVLHPDVFEGGGFGSSLAIEGGTVVVGAPSAVTDGVATGAAHAYVRGQDGRWAESGRLEAGDGEENDDFGRSVAFDGDMAIVGAPGDEVSGVGSGSAYIFAHGDNRSWTPSQKLLPADGAAGDAFGAAVAIQGDTAMVGATWHDLRGAVYVFTRSDDGTWSQTQKLVGGTTGQLVGFGSSIAVDGDTAFVGAPTDQETHVFTRGDDGLWASAQVLSPQDGVPFGDFGKAVAIDGDTAVIGANFDDFAGDFTGAAYVFARSGNGMWEQRQKLTGPDAMSSDFFGSSVAIDNDTVVIGVPGDDEERGSAEVFVRDGSGAWLHESRLIAAPETPGDALGVAVGITGDGVLVGGQQAAAGAVYAFSVGFVDDDNSVFEADIDWLGESGITKGCNPPINDQFCPNEPVTRGQIAAFLVRARELAGTAGDGDTFVDDNGSVFESAIEDVAAAGITRGCNPPVNDRYCPDDPVTRGQMAAFLVRAWDIGGAGGPSGFIDIGPSVFAADIAALAATGITRGCNPPTNDLFCPEDPVTRGQMAAFLRRAESWRMNG